MPPYSYFSPAHTKAEVSCTREHAIDIVTWLKIVIRYSIRSYRIWAQQVHPYSFDQVHLAHSETRLQNSGRCELLHCIPEAAEVSYELVQLFGRAVYMNIDCILLPGSHGDITRYVGPNRVSTPSALVDRYNNVTTYVNPYWDRLSEVFLGISSLCMTRTNCRICGSTLQSFTCPYRWCTRISGRSRPTRSSSQSAVLGCI